MKSCQTDFDLQRVKMRLILSFIFVIIGFFSNVTNGDLAADFKTLQAEVAELKKFKESESIYCSLHASGKCGSCICKDDFNLPEKYYCDCQNQPPERDCLEFYQKGHRVNGIYKVTMKDYRTTQVYCDQKNGGWTVIQRRMDGSTNFYRNWQQYKVGFGDLQREFWFGNDNIHLLTVQAIYPKGSEAMIEFKYFFGGNRYINKYSHFQVDNEKSKYMLHVSGPSGSNSPSYFTSYQDTREFSTYDVDNDKSSSYNCAKDYNYGGWWYNGDGNTCTSSRSYINLNGAYDKHRIIGTWYKTFTWAGTKIRFSEIKVRRLS